MMQTLNSAVEHSLSPQSIKWRIEAKRTGRSFAEVVMLRTLVYRVEQVFLIEKDGGLLLQHVAIDPSMSEHREVISAMLTAIQSFVRDSFKTPEHDGIGSVSLGDSTLWIETGPDAVLAAAIRGTPPIQLKEVLHDTLVAIHQDHLRPLATATAAPDAFASCTELMKGCLQEQRVEVAAPPAEKKKGLTPFHYAGAGLGVLILSWMSFSIWNNIRWGRLEDRLRAEPGIVLTEAEVKGSHFHVRGLRDPVAADPVQLAQSLGLPSKKLHASLSPYYSLDDVIIRRRESR
jgi:OOP family OmpA-OmpF porin